MEPCCRCYLAVRRRQHALECDICKKWTHRKCGTGKLFPLVIKFIDNLLSLTYVQPGPSCETFICEEGAPSQKNSRGGGEGKGGGVGTEDFHEIFSQVPT